MIELNLFYDGIDEDLEEVKNSIRCSFSMDESVTMVFAACNALLSSNVRNESKVAGELTNSLTKRGAGELTNSLTKLLFALPIKVREETLAGVKISLGIVISFNRSDSKAGSDSILTKIGVKTPGG